jgi:hypothetical protein
MDKKYMLPPDQPRKPRIGPQFQAQIPDLMPRDFQAKKRPHEDENSLVTKKPSQEYDNIGN